MKIITLCYRKIIDASSSSVWDKMVFEDSYLEFKMQAQYYNQEKKFHTFSDLIRHVPGAEQLHFLVSASINGYVGQLNEQMPDICDNLGRLFLRFTGFRFELINSHLEDMTKHQVAINFFSEKLIWHDTIADHLLLSEAGQQGNEYRTRLLRLLPYLSIHSLQI